MLKLLSAAAVCCLALAPVASAHQFTPPEITAKIPRPLPGAAGKRELPTQIELGRRLFEKENFGGNGRTCATCHAAKENFALSPADVARRPPDDPLFVFERFPGLAALENGPALRSRALICENLDGFHEPCVLRASPHIFGLALTTNPQANHPLVAALGWGGDGSPGDGSLRNFAVGAVVQHFPRSLDRIEGRDFRLPTAAELDAIEAFMLSVGRRDTPVVDPAIAGHLVFEDPDVTIGQRLFAGMPSRQGTRRCSGCHTGGGALNDVDENEQRAPGTELTPNAPACLFPDVPGDGGFGGTPMQMVDRATFCTNGASGMVAFRGNRFFSTQSTIEAADTAPFFHDHSAQTMEEVVDFYGSDIFNDSITGAGNGFIIPPENRDRIALFVRTLNVLENIRSAITAIDDDDRKTAKRDIRDAIKVIGQGNITAHQHTALPALVSARTLLSSDPQRARVELERARGLIAN